MQQTIQPEGQRATVSTSAVQPSSELEVQSFGAGVRAVTESGEASLTPNENPTAARMAWSDTEQRLLDGPHGRLTELRDLLHIMREFMAAFRAMHFIGPCVTVFGSARFSDDHPYYQQAREIGARLAQIGFAVVTGGGPGIMEAANRGAQEAGGLSVGASIELPFEQKFNRFLDKHVHFDFFFVRKLMLRKYSCGFIALPGGYGTLDEIFEVLTHIKTGKMKHFPVVLVGKEYWGGMMEFLRKNSLGEKTINQEELDSIFLTDSPEEAVQHVLKVSQEQFGVKRAKAPKPSKLLFEKRAIPHSQLFRNL